ncbi:hypothetical protein J7L01_04425, partial [bacterium]|nr:hypothetical protein [bacterium]
AIEGYLSLARPAGNEAAPVVLGEIAEEMTSRVRQNAEASSVEIVVSRGDERPVLVSESAIRRCILNILLNAIEAMPDGGRIEVAARTEGGEAFLTISDNGPGLDRKTAAHVFDPFFTTKPNGTGIGLTLSKRIIEDTGGRLRLKTSRGEGCTFEIVFPISADA